MEVAPSNEKLQSALETCGGKGASWKMLRNSNRTLLAAYLMLEANVWHTFVRSKLLPTTHDTTVPKEKVLLVFSILKILSIDLGRLLAKEILACAKESKGGCFSLI